MFASDMHDFARIRAPLLLRDGEELEEIGFGFSLKI